MSENQKVASQFPRSSLVNKSMCIFLTFVQFIRNVERCFKRVAEENRRGGHIMIRDILREHGDFKMTSSALIALKESSEMYLRFVKEDTCIMLKHKLSHNTFGTSTKERN